MTPGENAEIAGLQLSTTVRAIRTSLRDAAQTFSARRRIIGSMSNSSTSCSNVSFPTASAAVMRMVEAGILQEASGKRRGRLFV
jgi:hypothetical protein